MRFISLFAGIGGLDLGLERAGWTCVAQVEKDEFCRRVLAKHWPNVPRFDDVRSVRELPEHDAIVGGFPCQPVSVAGTRRGDADERWLWPEFYRLIREHRPAWVLAENVPGLRTLGADGVIEDLEREGYTVRPLVVGADDVGAPHRRKRVFIVGRVADADSERERDAREHRRLERARWEGAAAPGGARPQVSRSSSWPAGPREPQHGWEPPRLIGTMDDAAGPRRTGNTKRGTPRALWDEARRKKLAGPHSGVHEGTREAEPGLGVVPDGLPGGLAARDRRARLKALGNAVVPQVAEAIGRAILSALAAPEALGRKASAADEKRGENAAGEKEKEV